MATITADTTYRPVALKGDDAYNENNISIPKMPLLQVAYYCSRIRPIAEKTLPSIRKDDGAHKDVKELYYINEKEVDSWRDLTKISEAAERAEGLKPIAEIVMYHSNFGFHHYKLSMAEILAQIPAECINETAAFRIRPVIDFPTAAKTKPHGLYSIALTTLYGRTDELLRQEEKR